MQEIARSYAVLTFKPRRHLPRSTILADRFFINDDDEADLRLCEVQLAENPRAVTGTPRDPQERGGSIFIEPDDGSARPSSKRISETTLAPPKRVRETFETEDAVLVGWRRARVPRP